MPRSFERLYQDTQLQKQELLVDQTAARSRDAVVTERLVERHERIGPLHEAVALERMRRQRIFEMASVRFDAGRQNASEKGLRQSAGQGIHAEQDAEGAVRPGTYCIPVVKTGRVGLVVGVLFPLENGNL